MRLIDADALLEKTIGVVVYDEGGWDCNVRAVPDDVVENAPTIEAEHVRHGRWAYTHHMSSRTCVTDHVRCVVCNTIRPRLIGDILKYCPNCGAKMDGDTNESP